MLGGIGLSLAMWMRIARRDKRLPFIYLGALAGAFLGAKVVYLLAEGFMHVGDADMWPQLATGKSILGGLLGGYGGVELTKRLMTYEDDTGDWFALVAPVGIVFGRIGCWVYGCCQGVVCPPAWFTLRDRTGQDRWPAVPAEIVFNLFALGVIFALGKARRLRGQHFHLYLIAYGIFRFFHEFLREEPRVVSFLTGYQIVALAVLGLGIAGFVRRQHRCRAGEIAA
jgi:phosphatidylglycerol:prolipoprotein diacylglycerol transferase